MYFKVLLSKAGTSLENIPNAIDHIKLYPSFSSVSMGKIYTLHNLCAYKDLKSRATLVDYVENLLMRSGVVRLLIKMPKGHTEDMFTAQGYQKDPFVYYTKELLIAVNSSYSFPSAF